MQLPRTAAIAASALVLIAVGGVAGATIPDADGIVHACYIKSTGVIRVIDSATDSCKKGESALTLGEKGEDGIDGTDGADALSGWVRSETGDQVLHLTDIQPTITAFAACPDGKKAVGGGGHATINRSNIIETVITAGSFPSSSGNGWQTTFIPREGGFLNGDIVVYNNFVACANAN